MFAIGLMGMSCRLSENWEEEGGGNKSEEDGAEAGQGKVELSIGKRKGIKF